MQYLATGNLETKRATALLYGLQLASINSARLNTQPYVPNVIRTIDSFPEGLDRAQPGTVIEISTNGTFRRKFTKLSHKKNNIPAIKGPYAQQSGIPPH